MAVVPTNKAAITTKRRVAGTAIKTDRARRRPVPILMFQPLAVELMRIGVRLSEAGNEADAQAVIRICQVMQAGEDRLTGYGEEVKAGRIAMALE